MFVAVRTSGRPLEMARAVREAIGALDRSVPVVELRMMEEVVTESVSRERMLARFVGMFSTVALTLAAVGVLASSALRWRSRFVKSACESRSGQAEPAAIGHIIQHISLLVLIGLAIGVAAAVAVTRTLEGELFGIFKMGTNPAVFAAVTLILATTAVLASAIPAWRAATVDPLVALQSDSQNSTGE